MNRYILGLIVLLVSLTLPKISLSAETQSEPSKFMDIISLNYCTYALEKISTYNDRVVLDDEYNRIVNHINLKNISDQRVILIIQKLMDTLTKFRLSELEKSRLEALYEKRVERALQNAMISGVESFSPESRSDQPFLALIKSTNPLFVLASAGSVWVDYQKNMLAYSEGLAEHKFSMRKEAIAEINELNKLFLETYWSILRESDAPDEWRITLNQINALIETAKEKDSAVRFRNLVRLEREFEFIPVYWYYRADAAFGASNSGREKKYADDIAICVRRYEKSKGFFRRDALYASLLMLDVSTFSYSGEELEHKMKAILEQDPRDPSRRLFLALTYVRYGLLDEAKEHLQSNLDARKFEVVSREIMADIYASRRDTASMRSLLEKIMNDQSASNQEILNLLGKVPEERLVQKFLPEILAIRLEVQTSLLGFGKADAALVIPKRWVLASDMWRSTSLRLGSKGAHNPVRLQTDKDRASIQLLFKDLFETKDIVNSAEPLLLEVDMPTEYFPLHLVGKFSLVPSDKPPGKLSSAKRSAAKGVSALTAKIGLGDDKAGEKAGVELMPIFVLNRIKTPDSCFDIDVETQKLSVCKK